MARPLPRLSRLDVLVTLLLVVALGVAGWQLLDRRDQRHDERDRSDAVATATRVARGLTSLSADGADEALDQLADDLSPTLRAQLADPDAPIGKVLADSQVDSQGEVVLAGLQRMTAAEATALVAVTAQVRNTSAPQGEQRLYRFQVELLRDGDRWLVDVVELAP